MYCCWEPFALCSSTSSISAACIAPSAAVEKGRREAQLLHGCGGPAQDSWKSREVGVAVGRGHGETVPTARQKLLRRHLRAAGTAQLPSFPTCQSFSPGRHLVLQCLGAAVSLAATTKALG